MPVPRPLPKLDDPKWLPVGEEDEVNVPYVFVADSAFPLTSYCLKPDPERGIDDRKHIFNYRLTRFRRCSENAFGILIHIFGNFRTTINPPPETCKNIVLAAITLHNMLRIKSDCYREATDSIAEEPVDETLLVPIEVPNVGNNLTKNAKDLREHFADYFFGPGEVPWQWNILC